MITQILLFGLILLIGGLLGMLISNSSYSIFVIGGFIFVGMSALIEPIPTKQDVLDGKAVYQENIHIRDNDTIKTYEIVWKQKN